MFKFILLLVTSCLISSCESVTKADTIFLGQHIITMDQSNPQAIAIQGDKIIATGSKKEILQHKGKNTRVIELGDKALIPGFIDAHGHFSFVANRLELLDLSPPPVGEVETIDDIINILKEHITKLDIPDGQWIYDVGYDDSLLKEKRHPNKFDLDKASNKHPIIIRHVSGHLIAVNSLALEKTNVSANTKTPIGGIIQKIPSTKEPNGIIEETAMRLFPQESAQVTDSMKRVLRRKAFDLYASYGITTIQDCNVSLDFVKEIGKEVRDDPFPIDVVSYVYGNKIFDENLLDSIPSQKKYFNGFRNAGIKFGLDGSPQGRTAWLSKPYSERPEGTDSNYVAYPTYDLELYNSRLKKMIDKGVHVLVHANGDEAIEQMINGIENAIADQPNIDHRSVIIHAQLMREDQLENVKKLNIIPSYFSAHTFFWGDWHRISFGDKRAEFISPVQATIQRSIPFTLHNDAPVVPPDMMRLISITVNRKTRSGYTLGENQKATVMEALYACTLGSAYQYFEEDMKGSIEARKYADLVILSENPLNCSPNRIESIEVLETFSKGQSIFKK